MNFNYTEHLGRFSHKLVTIFAIYLIIYLSFFYKIKSGIGQYWDWTTPYFKDQISNFFWNYSYSWNSKNLGEPLGYSTDYFLRYILSNFNFVSPEIWRYIFIVICFSFISFFGYLIFKKYSKSVALSYLFGLFIAINPTIFYKMTAGHVNYLVSYPIFLFLIYYLLDKYNKRNIDIAIVAFMFSFVGMQIQFFVFAIFFFFFYFIVYTEKFSLKFVFFVVLTFFSINMVWVTNFLTDAHNVGDLSVSAAKVSFDDSINLKPLNIFNFSFSNATLISKYYNDFLIFINMFISVMFFYFLSIYGSFKKNLDFKVFLYYLFFLLIFSTSISKLFSLFPFNLIAPMFRESGHFSVIIFLMFSLTLFILWASFSGKIIYKLTLFTFCLFFIAINGYIFLTNLNYLNFSNMRLSFEEFHFFLENKKDDSRILSYPFFEQYSINYLPTRVVNGFNISNTGYDSFSLYSKNTFISNSITPENFSNSIQSKLTIDKDTNILKMYNIKYLFNFSNIYESNYYKFVPVDVYKDKIYVKNNAEFFSDLVSKNNIKKISENIYEISEENTLGYFFTINSSQIKNNGNDLIWDESGNKSIFLKTSNLLDKNISSSTTNLAVNFDDENTDLNIEYKTISPTKKLVHINNIKNDMYLVMSESYNKGWVMYPNTGLNFWKVNFPVAKNTLHIIEHYKINKQFNAWEIKIDKLCVKNNYCTQNNDGTYNIKLVAEFYNQRWFLIGLYISLFSIFSYLIYFFTFLISEKFKV